MKLNSLQMASFVARGFLRFDAVVPAELNAQFLEEAGEVREPGASERVAQFYGELMATNGIPEVPPGVPLQGAYAQGSAIARVLALPQVQGAIDSLVGADPLFDHHFLHITFPDRFHHTAERNVAQHTHQDSTIDPRAAFDIQIMYYPHAVTRDMGGTRFIPGTHLRKVSESAIASYQNVRGQQHMVCPAGTLLFMHHGIWHGGGVNRSQAPRYMFKIRINPRVRQVRLWDTADFDNTPPAQRPIFYLKTRPAPDTVESILTTPEPWFEHDTGRLEYLARIRLFRQLLGDPTWDADYWMSRVEADPMRHPAGG